MTASDRNSSTKEFRVLGPVELVVDGRRIDLGGPKPRMLLTTLIAHRNQVVPVDALIEALWDGAPPPTARKSLQKFVWALRKDLGDVLQTREPGYAIEIDDRQLDAAVLEATVREARAGVPGWEERLEDALADWRGDPYPELMDTPWGPVEEARLSELRLEALELLVEARISAGDFQESVTRLDDLVSRHPFRERLWALLMTALYRSGRQAEALDAYQRLRSTLGTELGIEPSPELSELEERILLQDPDLGGGSKEAPRHNLPASVTSFIGREGELADLERLLSSARLVTLLGPAGSGKTRIATEVGRRLLDQFASEGVWFVDLATITSPDEVAEAIAKVLGVGQFADRPPEETLVSYLARRRLLLVLDNCEHVIDELARIAQRLLRASEQLVVVATTRERLGIDGEVIFDVPPLPYPAESEPATEEFDAVRLFIDRARSVSRDEEVRAEAAHVGEIVRRLDGIPLALELAAARVRTLGLGELRERLDDRFSILTSPSRGKLERHQTLEAAVDWSYRLLSLSEQTLFARLSVFSGGFDLESAAVVCGFAPLDQEAIPDLVADLVDKSLVSINTKQSKRRYHLLETLRAYGRSQLDPDDQTRLRRSHMEYFGDLAAKAAARLRGPEQATWLAVLRRESDNMQKALRWSFDTSPEDGARLAVSLAMYWDSIGPRTEGNDWLRRAVDTSATLDPSLQIDALTEAASVASSLHASIPIGYARRAVDLAAEINDEIRLARALRALSWALAVDEQADAALEKGRRALEIFERHDYAWETALSLERLGQASYRDPEWSVSLLERALEIYRRIGDRSREALTLHKIADRLAHSLGDLDTALDYAAESVKICEEIGSTHDGGHAHLEYGKVLRQAGAFVEAVGELREALEETTKAGDERCAIRSMTALGNTLVDAGDGEAGAPYLIDALSRSQDLGERHTTRSAILGLARLHADEGRIEEATKLLGFVKELSADIDLPISAKALVEQEVERVDLRSRLGNQFDMLWARGRSMTIEEATDLALQHPGHR